MKPNKASLVRQLIPLSYHFDGYNELNCPNSRDRPFFSDNVINFGEHYHLSIQLVEQDKISLTFSSVCPKGRITFEPYLLTLEGFVSKLKDAVNTDRDFIPFEISVQQRPHTICNSCKISTKDCRELLKNSPEKVFAGVSFNFEEMKKALAVYFEITNTRTSEGGNNMFKKNSKFFGMNFEFGLSKDRNIASTMMGLAVKNTKNNNWYVFDPATNTRKNIANLKFGSFPVMLLPASQYVVGHLYKKDGEYYYAQSVNANGTVTLLHAANGDMVEHLPETSLIPGMNFITEVIAFDSNTLMNADSKENVGGNLMAAMLMMNWSKGDGAEFSLEDLSDESFNGMGAFMPMLLMSKGGNFGNMFTNPDGSPNIMAMMALGSGEGEGNEMMQMMLLSQLIGGGASSPLSNIIPSVPGISPAVNASAAENQVVCEKCNAIYDGDAVFCSKCGGKTKPMAKSCAACGANLKDGALFCHKCGKKVIPDVCSKCGKSFGPDDMFCSGCGTPVNGAVAVAKAAPEAPASSAPAAPAVPSSEGTEPTA